MSEATTIRTVPELELEVIDRAIAWSQEQTDRPPAQLTVQANRLYAAVKDLEAARNMVTQ